MIPDDGIEDETARAYSCEPVIFDAKDEEIIDLRYMEDASSCDRCGLAELIVEAANAL